MVNLGGIRVGASKPSMVDNALPFFLAVAGSEPQRSAIAASIGRILAEKRACNSRSSQVSSEVLRLLCGKEATPLRISPNVRTLRYRKPSSAVSNQLMTRVSGRKRTASETQFVSSK